MLEIYSGLHQLKEPAKPRPDSWAAHDKPVTVSTKPERGFHTSKIEPVRFSQIPGVVQSIWPSVQLPGGGHIW